MWLRCICSACRVPGSPHHDISSSRQTPQLRLAQRPGRLISLSLVSRGIAICVTLPALDIRFPPCILHTLLQVAEPLHPIAIITRGIALQVYCLVFDRMRSAESLCGKSYM